MVKNSENIDAHYESEEVDRSKNPNDVREVTIFELGRLVLMEYTKIEFWVDTAQKLGGIESLLMSGIKKIR